MEDRVIFDIIDHVDRWLGIYPESFMKIGHDLAEKLGAWRTLTVPDWRLEEWGHLELKIQDYVVGC